MATEILRPNGTGDEDEFTGIWSDIDDVTPDDDTTRVSHNATENFSSYNLDDSALTTETVDSVDVWARSKVVGGGSGWENKGIRLSASNTMEGQQVLTASYADREVADVAKPGGGNYSTTDLDSIQLRLGLRESATGSTRCTQAWVEVNNTPVAGGAKLWQTTMLGSRE